MSRNRSEIQEKRVLSVLQRSKGPLTARDVWHTLQAEGVSVDYISVAGMLNELVEKSILTRSKEDYPSSPWYRYTIESKGRTNTSVEVGE